MFLKLLGTIFCCWVFKDELETLPIFVLRSDTSHRPFVICNRKFSTIVWIVCNAWLVHCVNLLARRLTGALRCSLISSMLLLTTRWFSTLTNQINPISFNLTANLLLLRGRAIVCKFDLGALLIVSFQIFLLWSHYAALRLTLFVRYSFAGTGLVWWFLCIFLSNDS